MNRKIGHALRHIMVPKDYIGTGLLASLRLTWPMHQAL